MNVAMRKFGNIVSQSAERCIFTVPSATPEKQMFLQVLTTDFSARAAAGVMNRLAKLSARFIGEQGFSIGIDDVTPAHELQVCFFPRCQDSDKPMLLALS